MKDAVLITGVAGFIGSHLAERLLACGHEVVGLDNFDDYYSPSVKRHNLRELEGRGGFYLVEGDIRDAHLLGAVFRRYRIGRVVHLAARAGVRPSLNQPALYQEVNTGGTVNLLEVARAWGVRHFLFTSSSSVYGLGTELPFREEAKLDCPTSPYAASKLAAELFCRTYHHLYGIQVTIVRPFTVYGPRQRPEMAISRFTRQIDEGQEVSIFGDGASQRDYTYISDIVDGIEQALNLDAGGFQVFNLGSAQPVSLLSLVRIIEKTLGKEARIRYLPEQEGDMPITYADISKARRYLGYAPKVTLEEGIARFVAWYRLTKDMISHDGV